MSAKTVLIVIAVLLATALLVPIILEYLGLYRRKPLYIPDPLPMGGIRVCLSYASRLRGGVNAIAPALWLYPDGIEFRTIRREAKRYDEIKLVEKQGRRQVRFRFAGSSRLLIELHFQSDADTLLRFLESRGVPLGRRATEALTESR